MFFARASETLPVFHVQVKKAALLKLELHGGFKGNLQAVLCAGYYGRAVALLPRKLHGLDGRLELDETVPEAEEVVARGEDLLVNSFCYPTVVQTVLVRIQRGERKERKHRYTNER